MRRRMLVGGDENANPQNSLSWSLQTSAKDIRHEYYVRKSHDPIERSSSSTVLMGSEMMTTERRPVLSNIINTHRAQNHLLLPLPPGHITIESKPPLPLRPGKDLSKPKSVKFELEFDLDLEHKPTQRQTVDQNQNQADDGVGTEPEDAQFLVYCSADDFLPSLVSTPPKDGTVAANLGCLVEIGATGRTRSGTGSGSPFRDALSAFGDILSSPATLASTAIDSCRTISHHLASFKLRDVTGSLSRFPGELVASLGARYQNEFPDPDYFDHYREKEKEAEAAVDDRFEWEAEMRELELQCGVYHDSM